MTNLLAQRQEIKRAEKVAEKRRAEEEEARQREEEEVREAAVRRFEMVQAGLEGSAARTGTMKGSADTERTDKQGDTESKSRKRKFEIDEEELRRIAAEERARTKRVLDEERRAAKSHLPSFWVPGEIEGKDFRHADVVKMRPSCPCSDPAHPHALSLKTLVSVHFTTDDKAGSTSSSSSSSSKTPTCPSCRKTLSNASKAVLAVPCGHVLCKPCVDKFLKPDLRHQRDAHDVGPEPESVHCYVCDADLTVDSKKEKKKKKEGKDEKEKGVRSGLVEIRSEGTGFAGGGKAEVRRDGVAFQV